MIRIAITRPTKNFCESPAKENFTQANRLSQRFEENTVSTMGFEAVIGLEVHAQLSTDSKLFCSCSTEFGSAPNGQTCPICLGMPGVLPVLNRKAIDYAIKFGLAIQDHPARTSIFSRKNYFYPDLPKGYQITQFEYPVVAKGYLDIELENETVKRIGITRAHLEEDAGQSSHDGWPQSQTKSYVNLNRAGIPLLEIVSEPEIRSSEEAYAYLTELRSILRYLGICNGNMEEGSLRCDANVSVRPIGQEKFGTRTEIKNLNSFNNVKRGIEYEINRKVALISQGSTVTQCTLLWDVDTQSTKIMRTKEDAHDYRYFPEPDLLPLVVTEEMVQAAKTDFPELPRQKYHRFLEDYGIPKQDAKHIVSEKALASYFEDVVRASSNPKASANWLLSELLRDLKNIDGGIESCPVSARQLGQLIKLIDSKTISGKIGKEVFAEMFQTSKDPELIIQDKGLKQITDADALEKVVLDILATNPDQVEAYRGGRTKLFGFFVGQAMKATKGKGNPGLINQLLRKHLEG